MSTEQTSTTTVDIITTVDCTPTDTFINTHNCKSFEGLHLPVTNVLTLWEHKVLLEAKVSACYYHSRLFRADNFAVEIDHFFNVLFVNKLTIQDDCSSCFAGISPAHQWSYNPKKSPTFFSILRESLWSFLLSPSS